MKIKRLEIAGFKSFVDKTSIDFQRRVTAIVGPNGCGKSNVVDAIRWVMGEQSPKNLRGKNMEDVIFGGSESRKPLGMAEVSLIFSVEDGRVPAKYLDFSEIQVTRRLYRDGESEYLLNKTPCRLLDIAELFMDTGAGARAYSIIEQGKIGMILHSKPEERRFIIEEAAGVVKYKSRKQAALKKIEVTRHNLVRIGDIIGEIKRQLNALQRQAKKAARFREIREELKKIDLSFTAREYLANAEEKRTTQIELTESTAELDALVREVERAELELESRRLSVLEKEKDLTARQDENYRLKGDIREAEHRLEFQKKELDNLERHLTRTSEEASSLQQQLTETEDELKSIHEHKELFGAELESEEKRLFEAEQELAEMTEFERHLLSRIDEIRRELLSVLSEIAFCNNQHSNAIKRLENLEENLVRNEKETATLRQKVGESVAKSRELEELQRVLTKEKEAIREEQIGFRAREGELKERRRDVEMKLLGMREQLNKKASRLHSLQELEAQFAGYGQGIRSIFLTDRFKGVFRGVIADFIEVDEEYEAALEAVLTDKLQYVACAGEADALSAIDYLKTISGGRCSFLLKSLNSGEDTKDIPGAEKLLDKTSVSEEWRNAVGRLLRNVMIVKDLPTAHVMSKSYPSCTFVTPGGDMANAGGIIHGGSTEAVNQGLVHKKREIKVLAKEVSQLEIEVAKFESLDKELGSELSETLERIQHLGNSFHLKEIGIINNSKDLQRVREECQEIEERLVIKGLEIDQLIDERQALEEELSSAESQRSVKDVQKVELEKELEEHQELINVRKREIEHSRETLTSLKVRTAALKEKRDSNLRAISRVEGRISDLKARLERQSSDLEKGKQDRVQLSEALIKTADALKELLTIQEKIEVLYSSERSAYQAEADNLKHSETLLKECRAGAEGLKSRCSEKSIKLSELSMRLEHIEGAVGDKYRMEISEVIKKFSDPDFDEAGKRGRQKELQVLVDEMGEVNLTAIEEFRELEERHEFLSSQKSDLEESLHGLQQAIQRINRTTRKRFFDTFVMVNEKFQEVFPRLFCGGKAELKLTNEEDLLETGLDIIVQPPGKKLQNISLLSGGEKALTAVALMFSVFLIKPTPFCLLDEVDAPLDEANIRRFADMIRELSAGSQFIMITHDKTTMACADCLYGVTMEEPGVSRLVSVRLN